MPHLINTSLGSEVASAIIAGHVVTVVMLRGWEVRGEGWGRRDGEVERAVLRFSCRMNAAIVSSVRGRLAGTQLEERDTCTSSSEILYKRWKTGEKYSTLTRQSRHISFSSLSASYEAPFPHSRASPWGLQ